MGGVSVAMTSLHGLQGRLLKTRFPFKLLYSLLDCASLNESGPRGCQNLKVMYIKHINIKVTQENSLVET